MKKKVKRVDWSKFPRNPLDTSKLHKMSITLLEAKQGLQDEYSFETICEADMREEVTMDCDKCKEYQHQLGVSHGITRVLDILEELDKSMLEKVKDCLYEQDYQEHIKGQKNE